MNKREETPVTAGTIAFCSGRVDAEAAQTELMHQLGNAIHCQAKLNDKTVAHDNAALLEDLKDSLRQALLHAAVLDEYIDRVHASGLGLPAELPVRH